ncbi:MAG TPA: FixH family protein [Aestuariivirgaceae bacterium]|nr:FixH family protein [Aestuariivirgaceae bacterium]
MTARPAQPRAFTGRHMLAAMVAFFGVIVAVNLTMATFAMKSWTGLVVQNSYVASQEFNDRADAGRARAALGWQGDLAYSNGELRYSLTHANNSPVALTNVQATLGRPAYDADDTTIELTPAGDGGFGGPVKLGDGQWIVRVSAEAGLAESWLDIRRIHVRNGTAR